MNAKIMMMQIFHKIRYDLRGHLKISRFFFLQNIFCLTPNLWNAFQEWQHYQDANFSLNEVLKYHFYVKEKFCNIFTIRPSDLITTYGKLLSLFCLWLDHLHYFLSILFLFTFLYLFKCKTKLCNRIKSRWKKKDLVWYTKV